MISGGITEVKVKTQVKLIIGVVVILAVGFIGFQALKVESPDIDVAERIVPSEERRITSSLFVERTSEPVTEPQQEEVNIAPPEIETTPVPESVPTVQSDDAEIKEFQEWLSSILDQEETLEEMEQKDLNVEDDGVNYDLERSVIKSVVEDQWKNSLESLDIEGYMSSIWENDFFYVSDMGTRDNMDDDIIFRSGQEERAGTLKMFDAYDDIELSLYRNGDIEFLRETVAMADYDYGLKLVSPTHGVSYPSGRMFFILELRESGEWRILEWYDYATPDPNR